MTLTAETWHGTYNGYSHRRCRCDACRAANATFNRTRARAVQRLIETHQDEYRALLAEERRAAGGT